MSLQRPEFFHCSEKSFPLYTGKGENFLQTGSGWVRYLEKCEENERVRVVTEDGESIRYRCKECRNTLKPSKEWWHVVICTARHVIFDDSEVEATEVEFFFNDKGRNQIKVLQGVEMCESGDVEKDYCLFVCHTYDMELGQLLSEARLRCVALNEAINDSFNGGVPSLENPLTVIVSHPHGCAKQISVGEWKEREEGESDKDWTRYSYSCPTCPGTSGAWVWKLGCWKGWEYLNHPHSGSCEEVDLNQSGFGWEPHE